MPSQEGSVWPLVFGRVPQSKLFQNFFGEAVLLVSDIDERESPYNPSFFLALLHQLSLLNLNPLYVCVDVLEERFNLWPEDDRTEPIVELLFSQAAQIQKMMGFYMSLEIL